MALLGSLSTTIVLSGGWLGRGSRLVVVPELGSAKALLRDGGASSSKNGSPMSMYGNKRDRQ